MSGQKRVSEDVDEIVHPDDSTLLTYIGQPFPDKARSNVRQHLALCECSPETSEGATTGRPGTIPPFSSSFLVEIKTTKTEKHGNGISTSRCYSCRAVPGIAGGVRGIGFQ